jgi:hypothetical protein
MDETQEIACQECGATDWWDRLKNLPGKEKTHLFNETQNQ